MKYVGFVVDGMVPTIKRCLSLGNPLYLVRGCPSATAVAQMRLGWIAEEVNSKQIKIRYELYKPWRKYVAVVFLKSMNTDSTDLMRQLSEHGVKVVFDANVDYFTPPTGTYYYNGMAPSDMQRQAALAACELCDAVIADSVHIGEIAKQYLSQVAVITDNVRDLFVLPGTSWEPVSKDKLVLLWSGQAVKLFELLAIKDILLKFSDKIRLRLITNSLEALELWYPEYKSDFLSLLSQIEHEFIPFVDIEHLLSIYDKGGIFISPRFLDNSYNLGHTEWKITLALARGRVVLCSPQKSYQVVNDLAQGRGMRVCSNVQEWQDALSQCLNGAFDWKLEQQAAIDVVNKNYKTSVVAGRHLDFIREIIS